MVPCPSLANEEIELLEKLDELLNYFEHVLYLGEQRHLKRSDILVLLKYWFDLMAKRHRVALRQYAAMYSYELVLTELNRRKKIYFALYGTLMEGFAGKVEAGVLKKLCYKDECIIKGDLYDLGEFPGLVCGEGAVRAELYEVSDMSAIQDLDKFEQYDPTQKESSLYIRKLVKPMNYASNVWVYFYNRQINDVALISSGDWRKYKKS
jgi:gamma-glutamylcyclotransferase (GGCT)/AIG2-like uncharacterized protein YtfP